MLRIGIAGARGQLGAELCRRIDGAVALDCDITNRDQVGSQLQATKPHVVINTAAYTAVDLAEDDPSTCFRVNSVGARILAEETRRYASRLIQISTDYVFDSTDLRRPLRETDPAEPRGVYAKSKRAGELGAAENPSHLIVRTCGLYGRGHQDQAKNFVRTMLHLGMTRDEVRVVDDQLCNPTAVEELASALKFLAHEDCTGILHVVNSEPLTWCQFARQIFDVANLDCEVTPITTAEFAAKAPRPAYSVLDVQKYNRLGGPVLSDCRTAVANFVDSLATNLTC